MKHALMQTYSVANEFEMKSSEKKINALLEEGYKIRICEMRGNDSIFFVFDGDRNTIVIEKVCRQMDGVESGDM